MTTATTSAELESQLSAADPAAIMADPAKFAKTIKDYVSAVNTESVQRQIEESVQAGMAQFARDAGLGERPDIRPGATVERTKHYSPGADGAALDGQFTSMTDLCAQLRNEKLGRYEALERGAKIRNAFSTTIPSEGGYLVPEEFRAEMLRIQLEDALVQPLARVVPMGAPKIAFPMIDSTSNASNVHGGVTAYWTEESAPMQASAPTFGKIALEAHKLTGRADIPNELLADSAVSIAPLVDEIFPQALGWFKDLAFIAGTGVGQPLGFLNAASTVTVSKESSQAADSLLWANIVKMYSRMLPSSLAKAVWIMNNQLVEQLLQMTLPVKNVAGSENVGGSAVGITYGQGTSGPSFTLLGRPIYFSEKVPAIGDLGDVNFVDLSYYLIGDRQQVTAMTSEHVNFYSDATAYRITERVDGRPWLQSAITPNKGANSVSAFVKLEAR